MISIDIDAKDLINTLSDMQEKLRDLSPLMMELSEAIKDSALENFKEQGRPKWPDISPLTKKIRTKKGYWPGKILTMRNELAGSITSDYGPNYALAGTNKIYANIHQFGGTIKPKTKPFLFIPLGKDKDGKMDYAKLKSAKIPPRPFLNLTDSDINDMQKTVENYFNNV